MSESFFAPLILPTLIILCSVLTVGFVQNGSAGEYPVSKRASIYFPLYTVGALLMLGGLIHYFSRDMANKVVNMYNLVFIAYALASFSVYLGTYTVSLSLT